MNFDQLNNAIDNWLADNPHSTPKRKPTLENIVDVILEHAAPQFGPWIAGGAGRQLALGERNFADIDVWFSSRAQFEELETRLIKDFGNGLYETFASANATTYQVGDHKVQLIRRAYYPNLDSVFAAFDFTCCQVAVHKDLTVYGPGIDDARNHRLCLNYFDSKAFLARYAKYVGYGYVMDPDKFLEIIDKEDINYEFDHTDLGY